MSKKLVIWKDQTYKICDNDLEAQEYQNDENWFMTLDSGRFEPLPKKIAEVKKMALQELELQDTKDDIANEDVSRKELWRSAFECGVIALINKLDSNFSA